MKGFASFPVPLLLLAALWSCHKPETSQHLPDIEFENQLGKKLVDCLCEDSDLSLRPWRPAHSAPYQWASALLEGFSHPTKGLLHLKGRSLVLWEIDDAHHFGAYLLPGGHILVGEGLIDCFFSATEAEALLVHLLAHVALHHPMHLLLKDYPLSQLESVAHGERNRLCLGMALTSLFYSFPERLEAEADSLAQAWGLFCNTEARNRARLLDHCVAEIGDEDQYAVAVLHAALSTN